MTTEGKSGIDRVRAMGEAAEELPPLDPAPAEEPPATGYGGRGSDEQDGFALPEDCPVVALGVCGDTYYYLDELKQLRPLAAKEHSRLQLMSLFGRDVDFVYKTWPRLTPVKGSNPPRFETTGWKPELAAEALMMAAATNGPWSPFEKVRGRGAWLGGAGELVLHCGDVLYIIEGGGDRGRPDRDSGPSSAANPAPAAPIWREAGPGLFERKIYPTEGGTLRPNREPQPAGPKGPGDRLLRLFATWHWRRAELDPYLLLGWCCAAMMGGALDWRPLAWVTGGFGTGKSTLQDALKWLFGDEGILRSSDATAAGVRQTVGQASLPVALDETEAEEDNRKMNALVKLARDAASGSLSVRGGSDHAASSFTVRSCFLFSSILIPPLLPQDRSRIAVLQLLQLVVGAERPRITQRGMQAIGGKLLRRLVQQWQRWPETFNAYRDTLARAGHSARGQDVFGTLLAAADLALNDQAPSGDELSAWEEKLRAHEVAETDGIADDSRACLAYLMTSTLESPHDRTRQTIGWWVLRAHGHPSVYERNEEALLSQVRTASQVLSTIGLKLRTLRAGSFLAVANQHAGLQRIFAGTQWGGRPGADGVWKQSLGRLAVEAWQLNKQTDFAGVNIRSTYLTLDLCLPSAPSAPSQDNGSAAASPHDEAEQAPAAGGERRAADADQDDGQEGGQEHLGFDPSLGPDPSPGARP